MTKLACYNLYGFHVTVCYSETVTDFRDNSIIDHQTFSASGCGHLGMRLTPLPACPSYIGHTKPAAGLNLWAGIVCKMLHLGYIHVVV